MNMKQIINPYSHAFSSKAVQKLCMAGLLTRFHLPMSSPIILYPVTQIMKDLHNETHSSGTVQDFHLIPF